MIILLLVLIFFAILFPGFFRAVFGLMALCALYAFAHPRPILNEAAAITAMPVAAAATVPCVNYEPGHLSVLSDPPACDATAPLSEAETRRAVQRNQLDASMARLPGSYVGWVPGAYLTEDMTPLADEQLIALPIRDVDQACHGISECISSEQQAYDMAKYHWSDASITTRQVCVVSSDHDSQGPNSGTFYKRIQDCIEARLATEEAIRSLEPKHFHP